MGEVGGLLVRVVIFLDTVFGVLCSSRGSSMCVVAGIFLGCNIGAGVIVRGAKL